MPAGIEARIEGCYEGSHSERAPANARHTADFEKMKFRRKFAPNRQIEAF